MVSRPSAEAVTVPAYPAAVSSAPAATPSAPRTAAVIHVPGPTAASLVSRITVTTSRAVPSPWVGTAVSEPARPITTRSAGATPAGTLLRPAVRPSGAAPGPDCAAGSPPVAPIRTASAMRTAHVTRPAPNSQTTQGAVSGATRQSTQPTPSRPAVLTAALQPVMGWMRSGIRVTEQ